ncbi:MAG: hypothetical protein U5R06_16430 [candidate division KSB1 bacterium]|nr:hypothetical protein [candidate division KSB1 bacterium]
MIQAKQGGVVIRFYPGLMNIRYKPTLLDRITEYSGFTGFFPSFRQSLGEMQPGHSCVQCPYSRTKYIPQCFVTRGRGTIK